MRFCQTAAADVLHIPPRADGRLTHRPPHNTHTHTQLTAARPLVRAPRAPTPALRRAVAPRAATVAAQVRMREERAGGEPGARGRVIARTLCVRGRRAMRVEGALRRAQRERQLTIFAFLSP